MNIKKLQLPPVSPNLTIYQSSYLITDEALHFVNKCNGSVKIQLLYSLITKNKLKKYILLICTLMDKPVKVYMHFKYLRFSIPFLSHVVRKRQANTTFIAGLNLGIAMACSRSFQSHWTKLG